MRDFIVWMRPGNGPFVTKIYRVIEKLTLKGDRLVFVVSNQYAVTDPYFRPSSMSLLRALCARGIRRVSGARCCGWGVWLWR